MKPMLKPITILVAEDDPDDRKLTREAFDKAKLANDLRFVEDSVEVFDYLNRRSKFKDAAKSPWPSLLLDLIMRRKVGREVLRELHADPRFQRIRVIVMTTSKSEEDIVQFECALCAASFITKPVKFESLVEVIKALGQYWLVIVELPDNGTPNAP